MGKIGNGFSLLLVVVLATSSVIIFETARAQTTPPLPEFSITVETQQTVVVTINNSYEHNTYTFYNIRAKDHLSNNWTEFFDAHTYTATNPRGYISSSNSENTTVNLQINYEPGSQVDFQMEAIQYRESPVWIPDHSWAQTPEGGHYEQRYSFNTTTSGWGNTQTITIPSTNSNSISPSQTIPEFPITVILPLFVVIPLITAMILRKSKHLKEYN